MENKTKYNPEQLADINARITKAIDYIRSEELDLAAYVSPTNLGKDIFAMQVTPMFKDTKYDQKPIVSPLSEEMAPEAPAPVEPAPVEESAPTDNGEKAPEEAPEAHA